MSQFKAAKEFLEFNSSAPSAYHTVLSAASLLAKAGFQELPLSKPWELSPGSSYYINAYGTSLFAFSVGMKPQGRLHIAAAHTDYPCFKIKPNPEILAGPAVSVQTCGSQGLPASQKAPCYVKLNTTAYGGAILNTWLDRPLSAAGKVMTKSDTVFAPTAHYLDCRRPLFLIPNLAIHMNRDVNKGTELNKQTDLLPLAAISSAFSQNGTENAFLNFLAQEIQAAPEDILDYDLTLYVTETGCLLGMNEEFISAPRIDNQTSALSCLSGLLETHEKLQDGINLIALFDNEEVGSSTKQGADSTLLPIILEKLYHALEIDSNTATDLILNGFCLSLDVAHAIHPNHPEKCDPTNLPYLNGGIVIKLDAGQRYATDTEAVAILQQLCHAHEIPYQKFVNRSDMLGGSTLGSITSAHLPMQTVDLGIPMLAMHSARELMGSEDQESMNRLIGVFFQ